MTTFRRLLGFLRPYRRAVIASLVFASLAMVMTVAIPWLVGSTVNAIDAAGHGPVRRSCPWRWRSSARGSCGSA